MKRKVIVSITFVVLLCSIVLCVINQKKAPFIEGVIVEKNERFFTIETDIQEKIVCTLPKEYDYQDISLGDNIRVYYKGEILETSPARIKNVKEIKGRAEQAERRRAEQEAHQRAEAERRAAEEQQRIASRRYIGRDWEPER